MKRIDVFLGTECNNNCIFCCSKDNQGDLTTKEVIDILNKSYKDGAREVHFSGSEPTIRKDFFEIIRHAKKIGFENIKITTNGRMLAYPDFCRKMDESGVNNIIFSIHGHNAELHDSLTRVKGSFAQLLKGIKNAKKTGLKIESNTTIVKQNCKYLKEIAELLVSLDFSSSELIFVHPKGEAFKEYDKIVPRLWEVEKPLQEAIEVGIKNNKLILSRYVPFCFLGNYVNYCSEIYEPVELEQAGENFYDMDARKTRREVTMKKSPFCKECKYDLICMGIHKEHRGDEWDFKPVKEEKVNLKNVEYDKQVPYIKNMISETLEYASNILDVGCGFITFFYKDYLRWISSKKIVIFCLDPNPTVNKLPLVVHENYLKNFVLVNKRVEDFKNDVTFKVILLISTYHHLEDVKGAFDAIYNLLDNEGILVIHDIEMNGPISPRREEFQFGLSTVEYDLNLTSELVDRIKKDKFCEYSTVWRNPNLGTIERELCDSKFIIIKEVKPYSCGEHKNKFWIVAKR